VATNTADSQQQWFNALSGARRGIDAYEQVARQLGIDANNKLESEAALAIAVVNTCLLAGLPFDATTLASARRVLKIASASLDRVEATHTHDNENARVTHLRRIK